MPFIKVDAGLLTTEQKKQLIEELTESTARIMGLPAQTVHVLIDQNPPENWGVGGRQLAEIIAEREKDK